jgi:hypothetical protein
MKKITSQNFSKKLASYGALTLAIAGLTDANGQIVYTDIADENVNPGDVVYIDVDQDANGEFRFVLNAAGNFAFMQPVSENNDTVYNSNGFLAGSVSSFVYPGNLNSGDAIGAAGEFFTNNRGDLAYGSCYPNSNFCDSGGALVDGYIGLRLVIGGNTHYGWVGLSASVTSTILKDFAYNATPDEAINAGQQTLNIGENNLNNIKVVALNNTINLYNLQGEVNYKIYDISGKSVLKGNFNDTSHSIDASSISTGIYIIELNDNNTNSVIRKKVVL